MTMSAALDSGLAFSLVVIFFGFIYPGWMDGFRWWGTEVYKQVFLATGLVNKVNILRDATGRLAHTKVLHRVNTLVRPNENDHTKTFSGSSTSFVFNL